MKKQFSILWLMVAGTLSAQFQSEWITLLPKQTNNGEAVTGVLFSENRLIVSKKDASIWIISANGSVDSKILVPDQWINQLQIQKDNIFGIGTELVKTDKSLKILSRVPLFWAPNARLTCHTGSILKNSLYATHDFQYLFKYDLFGTQSWSVQVGNTEKLLIADDHIYIYSVAYDPSDPSGILKYDTLGNRIWRVDPGMIVSNIVTDNDGNCYVMGSGIEAPYGVNKLDKHGKLVWSVTYPNLVIRNGAVLGDSLFICGGDLNNNSAMYATISTTDGTLLEKTNLSSTQLDNSADFTHICPTTNAVYLGGVYGWPRPKAFIAKFSDPRYVALNENKLQFRGIRVYPNPARDEINVNLANWNMDANVTLTLRDQLGRITAEQKHQNVSFDGHQYKISASGSKGIYFLTVSNGENSITEKVIFD